MIPAGMGGAMEPPPGLEEYLVRKRAAMTAAAAGLAGGDAARETISATCTADDLSGVRRITIRDFQILSDSGPGFGGADRGPSSPELLLGVLASCLTHTYLIGAAQRGIPLREVRVRFEADNNDAGFLGLATSDPSLPFNIRGFVEVSSSAPDADLAALHAYATESCPLTRLVREPNSVTIETRSVRVIA
jgi:uncharacterized OsmC-like protein